MAKVLAVTFFPRGEMSNTKKLYEEVKANFGDVELVELDLTKDQPVLLDAVSTMAYVKRNYMAQTLSAEDAASLATADRHREMLESADKVILAYPMWNFSVPATVKAWIDEVVQAGKTFTMNESGFVGLLKGKKGLVIQTSGGAYDIAPMIDYDHATPLAKGVLEFMGIETSVVTAGGMNAGKEVESMSAAQAKIAEVLPLFLA